MSDKTDIRPYLLLVFVLCLVAILCYDFLFEIYIYIHRFVLKVYLYPNYFLFSTNISETHCSHGYSINPIPTECFNHLF